MRRRPGQRLSLWASLALAVVLLPQRAAGVRLRGQLGAGDDDGDNPLSKYYEKDRWGLTIFDYDRLGIQRGVLDSPDDATRAALQAESKEGESVGEEVQEVNAEEARKGGPRATAILARLKALGANEPSPELLNTLRRRQRLQRWFTFRKVHQTCPTFPFCNHIPPPPPFMPSPIDLSRPQGLIRYPFVAGATPHEPPAGPPSQSVGGEAAAGSGSGSGSGGGGGGFFGTMMSVAKSAMMGVGAGSAEHPGPQTGVVVPQSGVYPVGRLPSRFRFPFQRGSGNPYEYDQVLYFPPLGKVEEPAGEPDHTKDNSALTPTRHSSEDVDVRNTAIGDIPRAPPSALVTRTITSDKEQEAVREEVEGKIVEGSRTFGTIEQQRQAEEREDTVGSGSSAGSGSAVVAGSGSG